MQWIGDSTATDTVQYDLTKRFDQGTSDSFHLSPLCYGFRSMVGFGYISVLSSFPAVAKIVFLLNATQVSRGED